MKFLTKATLSLAIIGSLSILNAEMATLSNGKTINSLGGDTKLSCEALLCLASPTKPRECEPSLRKYFSLRKPHEKAKFLSLCPKDQNNDKITQDIKGLTGE